MRSLYTTGLLVTAICFVMSGQSVQAQKPHYNHRAHQQHKSCGCQTCKPTYVKYHGHGHHGEPIIVHICKTDGGSGRSNESAKEAAKDTRRESARAAPTAPVVYSMPMMMQQPMFMQQPMMMAAPANFTQRESARDNRRESASDSEDTLKLIQKRMLNLETQMGGLIETVERNSEAVGRIAEILAYNRGKGGLRFPGPGDSIPRMAPVPAEEVPPVPADEAAPANKTDGASATSTRRVEPAAYWIKLLK